MRELVKMKSGDVEVHFKETDREMARVYVEFTVIHNGNVLLQASGEAYSVPAMFQDEDIADDIIEWAGAEEGNEDIYAYVEFDEENCEQENHFVWEFI